MDFLEDIRKKLGLSKAEFARQIGSSRQAYRSLEAATDRIRLKDLIGIRKLNCLTDKELLDLLEKELDRPKSE